MNHPNMYKDRFSILVINPSGKVRQLHVPFRAQVINDCEPLVIGSWVFVEEIIPDTQHRLLYHVCGRWYPYHLFRLSVVF